MPMPGLAILLAKKGASKDDEEEKAESPEEESGEEDTKHAVMDALIKAIHDKDVEGALQAFEDLKDL